MYISVPFLMTIHFVYIVWYIVLLSLPIFDRCSCVCFSCVMCSLRICFTLLAITFLSHSRIIEDAVSCFGYFDVSLRSFDRRSIFFGDRSRAKSRIDESIRMHEWYCSCGSRVTIQPRLEFRYTTHSDVVMDACW